MYIKGAMCCSQAKPYKYTSYAGQVAVTCVLANKSICDQVWVNWSYPHILYFEKYKFEILNALFFSCGSIQSRQIYHINSVVIQLSFNSYFYKLLECCWLYG